MLAHAHATPESLRPARSRFYGLTDLQRHILGKILRNIAILQSYRQAQILEFWAEHGITDCLKSEMIIYYLSGNMRWKHFQATCNLLNLQPELTINLVYQGHIALHLNWVKAVKNPYAQLAMLINAWKSLVRPYMSTLKRAKFSRGERCYIEQRWATLGYVKNTHCGQMAFTPASLAKWSPDMAHIAVRSLGLRAETLCLQLIDLITATPQPAS